MKRSVGLLLIFSMVLAGGPSRAFADFKLRDAIEEFGEKRWVRAEPTRLQTGPVKVHPILRTRVEYDDNILLSDGDEIEDVVFNVTPGAIIEIPIDKHQVVVGYEADFEFFTKRTDQNDQNQDFFTLVDLHFPSWYINVLEKLTETSSRSGTTFTSRIPRIDHSINPKIGYKWKRLTFEAAFRHFVRDFRRQIDDAYDFQFVEWTGVVYYDLFARLKALLEYSVGQIDYDDAHLRAATINQFRVGLEGEIFPELFVKLRAGPQFRNYEESSEPNFNSWVANAVVEYQVRDNLKLELEFNREVIEATFADVNFYKQHGIRLRAEYTLRPQWILYTEAKYFRDDYAKRATSASQFGIRRDESFVSKTGIRYLFREWMEMELAYEFRLRDSNFVSLDYNNNLVSLSSSLLY